MNALVLLGFVLATLKRKSRTEVKGTLALLGLECVLWALILAPMILAIRRGLAMFLRAGAPSLSTSEELVMGLGAGLYEELLFRLIFIAGGYVILVRSLHVDPLWAQVCLILVSAILFSAFHHIGQYGETYTSEVFVFRFLAGVIFGLLYVWRGLAVVCWSHALYDVLNTLTSNSS
jgi:membrane protease YdiL (CAAX protease family)